MRRSRRSFRRKTGKPCMKTLTSMSSAMHRKVQDVRNNMEGLDTVRRAPSLMNILSSTKGKPTGPRRSDRASPIISSSMQRQKADCDRVPNTARAVELSPPSCFPVGATARAHCNFEKLVSYLEASFCFVHHQLIFSSEKAEWSWMRVQRK